MYMAISLKDKSYGSFVSMLRTRIGFINDDSFKLHKKREQVNIKYNIKYNYIFDRALIASPIIKSGLDYCSAYFYV